MKSGSEQLWKLIRVKFFQPGNKKFGQRVLHASPGKAFTAKGIDEQLAHLADEIETKFPQWEYSLVPTGPNSFNFVCQGARVAAET